MLQCISENESEREGFKKGGQVMLTDWFHRLGTSSFDNRPDVLASIVADARHTHLVSPACCVG